LIDTNFEQKFLEEKQTRKYEKK